jgi:hypothetical protein
MYIIWTGSLAASAMLLYNTMCVLKINMKYPHDTVNRLNTGTYQIIVVLWSLYNMIYDKPSYSLDESMIGYFLYDILSLLSSSYGHKQHLFFFHHIMSIYIIHINMLYDIAPPMYTNMLYFLMESGACMLNWMKLSKEYYPSSRFKLLTYTTYALTRGVCLPIYIVKYCENVYEPIWYQNVTVFMLCMLFILSMNWFRYMIDFRRFMTIE